MRFCKQAVFFAGALTLLVRGQEEEERDNPEEFEGHEGDQYEEAEGKEGEEPDAVMTEARAKFLFARMDTDGDGMITTAEMGKFPMHMRDTMAPVHREGVFEAMDTDEDGQVSLDEAMALLEGIDDEAFKERERLKFKLADKDGNGFINQEEFPHFQLPELNPELETALAMPHFKKVDLNGDGKLDLHEFEFTYSNDDDDQAVEVPVISGDVEQFFAMDKNKDNFLSPYEVRGLEMGTAYTDMAFDELIPKADSDGDGFVTFDEFWAARQHILDSSAYLEVDQFATHHEL